MTVTLPALAPRGPSPIREHDTTNLNATAIWPFIELQAELHTARITGSIHTFKEHLKADKRRAEHSDKTRLLNCRLYTYDEDPSGYVLFMPAFNSEGQFGYYLEDVYSLSNNRNKGLGTHMFCRMAEQALADGAHFIKWVTDERNKGMQRFSANHLQAHPADEINFDASALLKKDRPSLKEAWEQACATRPIKVIDAVALNSLGMDGESLAAKSHRSLPLTGFITYAKDQPGKVLAATAAYLNYSTFKTSWGINLETTVFAPGISDEMKQEALMSTAEALRQFKFRPEEFNGPEYAATMPDSDIKFAQWHTGNVFEQTFLSKKFGLAHDNMVETEPSRLILYVMPDQALQQLRPALRH